MPLSTKSPGEKSLTYTILIIRALRGSSAGAHGRSLPASLCRITEVLAPTSL